MSCCALMSGERDQSLKPASPAAIFVQSMVPPSNWTVMVRTSRLLASELWMGFMVFTRNVPGPTEADGAGASSPSATFVTRAASTLGSSAYVINPELNPLTTRLTFNVTDTTGERHQVDVPTPTTRVFVVELPAVGAAYKNGPILETWRAEH